LVGKIKLNTQTILVALVLVVAIALIAQFSGLFAAIGVGIPVEFEGIAQTSAQDGDIPFLASASYFIWFDSFTAFEGTEAIPYAGFYRISRPNDTPYPENLFNDFEIAWFLGDRKLNTINILRYFPCGDLGCRSPDYPVNGQIDLPLDIEDGTYIIELKTRPTTQLQCPLGVSDCPNENLTFVSVERPWTTHVENLTGIEGITLNLQRGIGPPVIPIEDFCGNAICEITESSVSCPSDCTDQPFADCGNDVCENLETEFNCPHDCDIGIPGTCGDGIRQDNENCVNCPEDLPPAECVIQDPVCEFNSDCETGFACINGLCQEGVEPPPPPPIDLGIDPIHILLGGILIALVAIIGFNIKL